MASESPYEPRRFDLQENGTLVMRLSGERFQIAPRLVEELRAALRSDSPVKEPDREHDYRFPDEIVVEAGGSWWGGADTEYAAEYETARYVRSDSPVPEGAVPEALVELLEDLVDPDDCWYDHHGYCQAHGWFETDPACPHKRAKDLLPRPQVGDPNGKEG